MTESRNGWDHSIASVKTKTINISPYDTCLDDVKDKVLYKRFF